MLLQSLALADRISQLLVAWWLFLARKRVGLVGAQGRGAASPQCWPGEVGQQQLTSTLVLGRPGSWQSHPHSLSTLGGGGNRWLIRLLEAATISLSL